MISADPANLVDCPFEYNGNSNLTVEIRYIGGVLGGGFTGPVRRDGSAFRIYAFGTGAYNAVTGSTPGTAAFKIRFTLADTHVAGGSPTPGGTVDLRFEASSDPGLTYIGGSSLGGGPLMVGCWPLELDLDGLLLLSAGGALPTVFKNYQGALNANGVSSGVAVNIPNVGALVGTTIHSSFITIGPVGLKTVGKQVNFAITP